MALRHKMIRALGDYGRIVRAGSYSVAGLRSALKREAAFRQEVILFAILAPLGFWFGDTTVERALLVGSLVIVLIVELLNSAVEAAVDRIGKQHHKLSGRAKDMGSAAVTLSLLLVVYVWALIAYEHWR